MNLNIYIIEDDTNACKNFTETAEHIHNISIIGFTDDANSAYSFINENNPDAIILDLELNAGSGPELLKKLNELPNNQRPYIVVSTNNSNPITIEYLHKNGTGFIFSKYERDYSEYKVLNYLSMFATTIHDYRTCSNNSVFFEQEDIKSIILSDIDNELIKFGIAEKNKGYQYLKSAIYYVITNSYDSKMLTELATYHNCSTNTIECNMRYAIKSAWEKYKSFDHLKKVYSGHITYNLTPPSSGTFISHYAELLKTKHHSLIKKLLL